MSVYALAEQIPSMGGRKLGPLLRNLARDAEPGTAIVEVGCWLGAGTAQLALGISERKAMDVTLHCFDRWTANEAEVEKAAKAGWQIEPGEDTLPRFRAVLAPLGVPLACHKGDLLNARWDNGPISVYVDDASKMPNLFVHVLRTFGPSWIPGTTIVVLMDLYMWKKSGDKRHECQKDFLFLYHRHFKPIQVSLNNVAFRYVEKIDFEDDALLKMQENRAASEGWVERTLASGPKLVRRALGAARGG
jgi:hypothetical protein